MAKKRTRLLQRPWAVAMIARLVRGYVWLVVKTSRVDRQASAEVDAFLDSKRGGILVCSHGRILALAALYQRFVVDRKLYGLHSGHRDGQLVGAVVGGYPNIDTIEGSSTRGGAAAIREIKRAVVEEGALILITPDGPRGPRLRNRSAVGEIARECGCPIVGFSVSSRRGFFLKTWDRFLLLTPFDHLHIAVAPPFDPNDGDRDETKARIEEILIQCTQSSDKMASRTLTDAG